MDNSTELDEVVIHSLKDCYYCEKAKNYLDETEKPYTVINYDKNDEDYKERVDKLIKITNHRKFPQIFVNGEFIGGYHELLSMYHF